MFIELQATQKVLSTALDLSAESLSAGEIMGGCRVEKPAPVNLSLPTKSLLLLLLWAQSASLREVPYSAHDLGDARRLLLVTHTSSELCLRVTVPVILVPLCPSHQLGYRIWVPQLSKATRTAHWLG